MVWLPNWVRFTDLGQPPADGAPHSPLTVYPPPPDPLPPVAALERQLEVARRQVESMRSHGALHFESGSEISNAHGSDRPSRCSLGSEGTSAWRGGCASPAVGADLSFFVFFLENSFRCFFSGPEKFFF